MTNKYTQDEARQARDHMLRQLDICEMETGDLTLTCLLGVLNGLPVYGRLLMTQEHANWIQEIMDSCEEDL